LLVCKSTTLPGNTTTVAGLPITTAERALADLARGLDDAAFARCVREALRLRVTTCARIQVVLARASGPNRPRRLRLLANRYARLPIARAASDPEARAVELLDLVGALPPAVNAVIAGKQADLSWPTVRHIVELARTRVPPVPRRGSARKQAIWERAGWTVDRIPTNDVYDNPERLFAAAEPAMPAGLVLPMSPQPRTKH
jgi:hypothetical protein